MKYYSYFFLPILLLTTQTQIISASEKEVQISKNYTFNTSELVTCSLVAALLGIFIGGGFVQYKNDSYFKRIQGKTELFAMKFAHLFDALYRKDKKTKNNGKKNNLSATEIDKTLFLTKIENLIPGSMINPALLYFIIDFENMLHCIDGQTSHIKNSIHVNGNIKQAVKNTFHRSAVNGPLFPSDNCKCNELHFKN